MRSITKLPLREKDIAKCIADLLELDGWRLLFCEPMSRRDQGRGFGEPGMADLLAIRYDSDALRLTGFPSAWASIFWIEFKKPAGIVSAKQRVWHQAERVRGALTIILGEDCEASVDSWIAWYRASGLNRGRV